MNTKMSGEAVRGYVGAVRAHLSDLPVEDADDLTSGLEADLAERAAELPAGADLAAAFGAPQAYAAELRSAAGLPPFVAPPSAGQPGLLRRFELWLRARRDETFTRWPWLRELRPLWWLLRGFVLGFLPAFVYFGGRSAGYVLGLLGAVLSFVWSRKDDPAPSSTRNRIILNANVVALLLLLPVLASALYGPVQYVDVPAVQSGPATGGDSSGVWVNGEPASNLYAYDAEGNRIDRVRLFNQYGQAVAIGSDGLSGPLPEDFPQDEAGVPDLTKVTTSVFPMRWGVRTGWEASLGGRWEPPVKISSLPGPSSSIAPETSPSSGATNPTPGASESVAPRSSTSPSPTGATSPSPSASPTP